MKISWEGEEDLILCDEKKVKVTMEFKYNPEFIEEGLHLFITEPVSEFNTRIEIFGKIIKIL